MARFAGEHFHQPSFGDTVLVLTGEHQNRVFEVVDVTGFIGALAWRVHVVVDGEEVWYWPWNLKVLRSKSPRPIIQPKA